MEVKIQIPDNCELIKDGNTYIVKEKKNDKPRTWEEFYENYPVKAGESYIMADADKIFTTKENYDGKRLSKSWCISKEEAEAFLALMQLRQLRKAWVGDWKDIYGTAYSIYVEKGQFLSVARFAANRILHFPTEVMAKEFLNCFRDLCETAKVLL